MSKTILYDSAVASITIEENGIYIFNLKDTYIAYDKLELEKHFELFNKHSKGQPYKVLCDATESINIPTDDAGLYFRENNRLENKFAIVTTNIPIQIFMGNLIKHKNVRNVKLFKFREEAREWLIEDTPK